MPRATHRRTAAGKALHGLLVIDKPRNLSSNTVVTQVKIRLGCDGIGHTGTLNPIATGVLPLCLGEATKLAGHLLADDKGYEAELELGVETDTLDADGEVVARAPEAAAAVDRAAFVTALAGFTGAQEQVPPMYSALKQGGRRLHEMARAGEVVERAPRSIVIARLELLELTGPHARIAIECSKGTYVRTLVADLGRALGCGAHLTGLRRTRSGMFGLERALRLEDLTPALAAAEILALPDILDWPGVLVPALRVADVVNGKLMEWSDLGAMRPEAERVQLLTPEGKLLALATVRGNRIGLDRVFTYGLTSAPASSNLQRSKS